MKRRFGSKTLGKSRIKKDCNQPLNCLLPWNDSDEKSHRDSLSTLDISSSVCDLDFVISTVQFHSATVTCLRAACPTLLFRALRYICGRQLFHPLQRPILPNIRCKKLTALTIDMMAPAGIVNLFVAAIQASLSVVLVIFYGAVAARFKLLDASSSKSISKVCVKIFLPALLLTKIGSELQAGSAERYGIILLWAFVCHFISFLIGIAAHLLFGMPDWITAALMFNNTTRFVFFLELVYFYLRLIQELQDCGLRSLTA